jgi:hypothetical protein
LLLEGKITQSEVQRGRERHWSKIIQTTLSSTPGKALIRTGIEHLGAPHSVIGVLKRLQHSETGILASLVQKSGIKVEVVANIANVNEVFGKD